MRCQSLHPSHHAPEEIKTGARAWTGLQRVTHGAQEPTHGRHRVAPMHHKQIVSPHTHHPKTRSRHRCTGCVATAAGLQPQASFFPSLPIPTLSHYHPHPAATTALLETETSRIRLWRQGHVHGQMAHAPFGSRTRGRLVARSRPHVAQNAHFWWRQPAHAHAYARACTHKMIKINLNNTYAN